MPQIFCEPRQICDFCGQSQIGIGIQENLIWVNSKSGMANKTFSYQEILKSIKSKQYKPVYLFCGEESYFIDSLTNYAENNILNESEKSFDFTVFYGKETDSRNVASACKRYPMTASHQLIIVKEAQNLKISDAFLNYLENPTPTSILILAYKNGKPDKREKFYKTISKHAVFEGAKLYENQLHPWIKEYCKVLKFSISDKAAFLLAQNVGSDLSRIASEINKVLINIAQGEEISEQDIAKTIGISKEFGIFELQSALGSLSFSKAIQIIKQASHSKSNVGAPVFLSNSLFGYFSKVYLVHTLPSKDSYQVSNALGVPNLVAKEYLQAAANYSAPKLEKIFSLLHEFDLASKGVNGGSEDKDALIEDLMLKIFSIHS